MHTFFASLGAVAVGLGFVSAQASPLANDGAGVDLVQYYYRDAPDWYYGPKWGGYGSAYGSRYGYRWDGPGFYGYYGYSPRYGYRSYRYRY